MGFEYSSPFVFWRVISSSFAFFQNLVTQRLFFQGIVDACLKNGRAEIAKNASEINFCKNRAKLKSHHYMVPAGWA